MTKQEKIEFIIQQLEIDSNLIKIIKTIIIQNLNTADETKLDELIYILNEE